MNIFDTIAALVQGQNPDQAVLSGAQVAPPGPPLQASAAPPQAPPQAGAPQGVPTPFTDPRPANQTPTVTQSPPDLANMYLELMRKNQNAQQLDSGLTMIAAGLTRNQGTREALLAQAGKGGAGTTGMTAADFVNMQKLQQAQQQQLLFNSAKQGLMKKYNLSDADMAAMTPDTANEIIKHHATQNLVHVQAADGSSAFYNATNGQKVADISGPKADDTEVVTDQNTGKQQLISKRTGQVIREITGETKPTATEIVKDDNTGEQKLVEKETGKTIQQLVPPRQPGQKISEDDDKLFQINQDRLKKQQPPLTMEDYLKNVKKSGVSVNVSPTGVSFPDPSPGQDYVRNPDGTVKVGADGKPTLYDIAGSKAERETQKFTEAEQKAQKAEQMAKVNKVVSASNLGTAVDKALPMVDQFGVTGTFGPLMRSPPFNLIGNKPSDNFDALKSTVESNLTTSALKQLREESKTGSSGLGQVTEYEDKMLASTVANLRTAQGPEQMRDALYRVKAVMTILAADSFTEGDQAKFSKMVEDQIASYKREAAKGKGITLEQVKRVP